MAIWPRCSMFLKHFKATHIDVWPWCSWSLSISCLGYAIFEPPCSPKKKGGMVLFVVPLIHKSLSQCCLRWCIWNVSLDLFYRIIVVFFRWVNLNWWFHNSNANAVNASVHISMKPNNQILEDDVPFQRVLARKPTWRWTKTSHEWRCISYKNVLVIFHC